MSRMFILVLPHKENKLHPIYRTIKSQDDFINKKWSIAPLLFVRIVSCKSTRVLLHQVFQRNALEGHLGHATFVEDANGFLVYHR